MSDTPARDLLHTLATNAARNNRDATVPPTLIFDALREARSTPAEDGPTWRALEHAMKRYLDAEPGSRDWMPVQEALWERDRFHAAEARSTPAEALDPKRVEMWQRLIESRDYAAETGMDDIGDSIECLARWALDDIAAARAAARKEVLDRLAMREVSVGPLDAYSKRSVLEVLDSLSTDTREATDVSE